MRERRTRKCGRPPTYRIENEYNPEATPQYIQITVNVLEARKLAWSNPQSCSSYVMVVLGRKKHRTTVRKNMEEPLYREYLVFEMHISIREIQRSSLWLAVMEPKCYAPHRVLGEATIDLGAIWAQPSHQVYHKWVQLTLQKEPQITSSVGFLKVDISIIFKGEIQVMPAIIGEDKVEEILLLPTSAEQQRANYIVTVHAAFSLPNFIQNQTVSRTGNPPSTYVRVSFCGLVAKTGIQPRTYNPRYNEQISMVEMFPNMIQTIRFEVCVAEGSFNRVLTGTELKMAHISHDGENGFLPTFGPSLLHMYGLTSSNNDVGYDGPHHKGALLVSLKTIVPYYQQALRSVTVEPGAPIQTANLWLEEDFLIYCPIFEISMLDRQVAGKYTGIAITIGEIPTERIMDEEFLATMKEFKCRKLHYTGSLEVIKTNPYGCIEFPHGFPVLQLATRLPDFRFRMYRNNVVFGIFTDLEKSIKEVEKRLNRYDYTSPNELLDDLNKALDDAAGKIQKYLDIIQYSSKSSTIEESFQQYSTELDQRQLALQKEEIEKIYNLITRNLERGSILNFFRKSSRVGARDSIIGTRKPVKTMLAETKSVAQCLKNTIYKSSEGWPDIIIWLLNEGSRAAYAKISAANVVFSAIPEQCGSSCGKIQTIYMKPLKCPNHTNASPSGCLCVAGKVELMMWLGLFQQRHAFTSSMPIGYTLKIKDYDMHVKSTLKMVECRAFIYRAKFTTVDGENSNITFNSFVRINALSNVKDTQVQLNTSLPLWNQVLKIQKMMHISQDRLNANPPYVLVEVYDLNLSGKEELIGRFQIQPVIDNRTGYAPRLQWYKIYKGQQNTGQILMSIQILQVPERELKTTFYAPVEESFYDLGLNNKLDSDVNIVEQLPTNLIPHPVTYKIDVYWWGLRDLNITRKPCIMLEIDELVLKSDIICDKKSNSNFKNGRMTQILESSLSDDYSPTLSVRLYDSSTFGRTLYLGTNIVKNPIKYIVDWLPKKQREVSLKSVSIMSSDFCEVGDRMLYVKKSNKVEDCEEIISKWSTKNQNVYKTISKKSRWGRLFSRQEPSEEEITLLPVYAKENNQIKVVRKIPKPAECNDWWMRFFQSENNIYDEEKSSADNITIYDYELEYQPEFSRFKDWCSTFKLYNGKKSGVPERDEQLKCGNLKAGIAIYKWPPPDDAVAVSLNGVQLDKGYFNEHPSNDPTKYLVRVYMVKAINLPKDFTGKSDPYIIINCGKKQLGDRKQYVSNATEPIFGKMYEFSCTLPEDYLLNISLYDYDDMPPDELIGSTSIDLEDRIYSKHRARVGLAPEYCLTRTAKWRDCVKPSVILEELCKKNHILPPLFPDAYSVIVNGVEYRDNVTGPERSYTTADERKENICLSILHNWQTLPICGHYLVPEHVETRSLYHSDKPGFERGKIQLWVDIFPLDASSLIPSPRDITPRKVEEYELRVIVWDVQSTILGNGTKKCWKTADLYVKIWIGLPDRAQQTDVHYNSLSGEGNFNWRMVFNFLYHHAERKIVNREKCPFTEYEEYVLPTLEVHLMGGDEDIFLGSLSLNLNTMYQGAKLAQHCSINEMETGKKINLFSLRSIRAWWPLKIDGVLGEDVPVGVIDLEMTLLPQEKAVLMPCGVGRDPPCPLPTPLRPKSSNENYKLWCGYIHNLVASRGKEALILIVILSAMWFCAYLLYLFVPSADYFICHINKMKQNRHRNVEGVIRTLYPLRL